MRMPHEKCVIQVYSEYVQKKFRRAWKAPPGRGTHVCFMVEPDGAISEARVHDSSGDPARDQAALDFIRAQTLKPLPQEVVEKLGKLQIDYLL
jgi:TonB family protein